MAAVSDIAFDAAPATPAALASGLRVSGLSWRFGDRLALDDVGFTAAPGRFTALLGPNGAGKTTLFNLLTRLYAAREGRIEIAGHDLSRQPRAAMARLGVVFQQPTLDLDLSVQANMRYFAALHGVTGADARRRIEDALTRLGMAERAREPVRNLNGGHRRRMEIARALLHSPDVLLLDEPTVGLDAPTRTALVAHVHALAADGVCVLWATHLTDEVRPDDDVLILHRGRLIAEGRAADISGPDGLAPAFARLTGGTA